MNNSEPSRKILTFIQNFSLSINEIKTLLDEIHHPLTPQAFITLSRATAYLGDFCMIMGKIQGLNNSNEH